MKTNTFFYTTLLALALAGNTKGQETKQKTFPATENIHALIVANINGSVNITGSDQSDIRITSRKTIDAADEKKVSVHFEKINDTLLVFLETPCNTLRTDKKWNTKKPWAIYCWTNSCEEDIEYIIDFNIDLPKNLTVFASTINEGDLTITDCVGPVATNNINGSITLTNVIDITHAKTINGDLKMDFVQNPAIAGDFYTLNGDIEAFFLPGLAADISFKSFNGDFFTNVEDIKTMPTKVEKLDSKDGFTYKIGEALSMRIGQGSEVHLNFETFNGDAILKIKSR